MQDRMTITDRAAAAVFAAPMQGKIVQTLIGEAMTMVALARITQMPLNLLHYHVAKYVRLGLIDVEHVTPRAGRPVKHYRATAKTFFVPSGLLAKLPGAELTRQLREALDRNQARSVEGVNFTHDGRRPCIFLVKDPASQATAIELWLDLGLTRADSAALIADLRDVVERYRGRNTDDAPRYLVHLAAARVRD
jgi:hypothetical protein